MKEIEKISNVDWYIKMYENIISEKIENKDYNPYEKLIIVWHDP
jgi:hypothetical protein